MIKVTKEIMAKLNRMSLLLSMPKTQCINMLVSEWLKNNDKEK